MIIMIYPRYTHDEKKSTVITQEEIKYLQTNYKESDTLTSWANLLGVCIGTIKWWTNPEWRENKIKDNTERAIKRIANNPDKKEKILEQKRKQGKLKSKTDAFRKYNKEKYYTSKRYIEILNTLM